MVTLRFAVPAILATAAAAGCFCYFVIVSLPARFEAGARLLDARLPPAVVYSSSPSARASTQIDEPKCGRASCRSFPKSCRGDPKESA